MTFGQMYNRVQLIKGTMQNQLQVYSSGEQVNILNIDNLSIKNICFRPEDKTVVIYDCKNPGYADYDYPERIVSFNESINILPYTIKDIILKAFGE